MNASLPALGQSPPQVEVFSGLLALDKPAGVTSHDVVAVVRRRLRAPGAGHLGTLDPGASGLLVIALGAATRAIPVWQGGEKTYDATLCFGIVTSTQDVHGEVLERREVRLDEAQIRAATRAFVGDIEQVPPMVSALSVGGQRLHRLARRGIEVERVPRRIRIASWEWQSFALPEARFIVRCTSGTYVRTLAHDLGAALGPGAALKTLRRLRSEPFGLERAVPLRELSLQAAEAVLAHAWTLDDALEVLPAVTLDADAEVRVGFGGRPVVEPGEAPLDGGPRSVVLRDASGRALALGELRALPDVPGQALVCPHVVFPWAVRQGRP
ncbi:MAG TPA: tRNA pseudouridine(55) synthase TruB [Candidatus Limnocylindria bacterium]|nr:tRNA pseudouridine(55) synthase TruB [Candidatus Limnocylindria bacterium]